MKKSAFLLLLLALAIATFAQQKKPLDHTVYDHWKDLKSQQLSQDGRWVSYQINPQQGDGWLYVYNVQKSLLDSVPRGHKARFMPDGKVLVYQIKPRFQKVLLSERRKV